MSASQPIEWTVAQLAQAVERGQLELHYLSFSEDDCTN
ncbi:Uncharacterised protein [Klebsiella pneumoniae]|nr:Uncharacterised protein [Klebsiella pneumoniae]